MELIVKAKHFKGARYIYNCNCGLSNAANEQFNTQNTSEGVDSICIYQVRYKHEFYGADSFYEDYDIAKINNFDETIIRTIKLTES